MIFFTKTSATVSFNCTETIMKHKCRSPVLLFSTAEIETHAYKDTQKENHNAMTCKKTICLFLPEHLILYGNNSVMLETWHRMANSTPSILLWTMAFTLYQFLKTVLEVTHLPQTKLPVGLCKHESCLERRMWMGKGVAWRTLPSEGRILQKEEYFPISG